MPVRLTTIIGCGIALTMVVGGMWLWNEAYRLAADTARPDVSLWAIRSAAVALAAAAQPVAIGALVCRAYQRALFDNLLTLLAGITAAVAGVSAIALGLAGH